MQRRTGFDARRGMAWFSLRSEATRRQRHDRFSAKTAVVRIHYRSLELEKAPYAAKDEKLKAEYTKKIHAYNNPQAGEASGDSDKSKSR
ncbi:hypothetical protein ZWY2020_052182 [Hordeum vulgare]|nr:hypothetical protein ZWY2020_052182 [Hordeum vulgare]